MPLSSYAAQEMNTNKIEKVGTVGAKKYTNKSSRDNRFMHPHTLFIETLLLENKMSIT